MTEPAEVEPATGLDIARALAPASPLAERMSRVGTNAFDHQPELAVLYQDVFAELLAEAETVPGYGTAMAMLLERYAFVWTTQRAADLMDTPLNARDYDQLILRFRQLWDGVLRARDDRQADAQFKHAFINAVMRVLSEVLEDAVGTEQATNIQARMVDRLRAIDVQATETRRRS